MKNNLNSLEIEHPVKSDSRLEELIDHIGSLLADEFFQLMEEASSKRNEDKSLHEECNESSNLCSIQF